MMKGAFIRSAVVATIITATSLATSVEARALGGWDDVEKESSDEGHVNIVTYSDVVTYSVGKSSKGSSGTYSGGKSGKGSYSSYSVGKSSKGGEGSTFYYHSEPETSQESGGWTAATYEQPESYYYYGKSGKGGKGSSTSYYSGGKNGKGSEGSSTSYGGYVEYDEHEPESGWSAPEAVDLTSYQGGGYGGGSGEYYEVSSKGGKGGGYDGGSGEYYQVSSKGGKGGGYGEYSDGSKGSKGYSEYGYGGGSSHYKPESEPESYWNSGFSDTTGEYRGKSGDDGYEPEPEYYENSGDDDSWHDDGYW